MATEKAKKELSDVLVKAFKEGGLTHEDHKLLADGAEEEIRICNDTLDYAWRLNSSIARLKRLALHHAIYTQSEDSIDSLFELIKEISCLENHAGCLGWRVGFTNSTHPESIRDKSGFDENLLDMLGYPIVH